LASQGAARNVQATVASTIGTGTVPQPPVAIRRSAVGARTQHQSASAEVIDCSPIQFTMILHSLTHSLTHNASSGSGEWTMGGAGENCGAVCSARGKVCNSARQSQLTTNELVRTAFAEAGYTCVTYRGARDFAGAPYSKPVGVCGPIRPGPHAAPSSCSANKYSHHAPLCYCEP
jgi:hypothetical protein